MDAQMGFYNSQIENKRKDMNIMSQLPLQKINADKYKEDIRKA
jgi:hypothetical protein